MPLIQEMLHKFWKKKHIVKIIVLPSDRSHTGGTEVPKSPRLASYTKADSRFAPSQWETVLLCNDVSHWLGASLDAAPIKSQKGLISYYLRPRPGDILSFPINKTSMMGPIPSALEPIRIMTHGPQGPIRKSIILNLWITTSIPFNPEGEGDKLRPIWRAQKTLRWDIGQNVYRFLQVRCDLFPFQYFNFMFRNWHTSISKYFPLNHM